MPLQEHNDLGITHKTFWTTIEHSTALFSMHYSMGEDTNLTTLNGDTVLAIYINIPTGAKQEWWKLYKQYVQAYNIMLPKCSFS